MYEITINTAAAFNNITRVLQIFYLTFYYDDDCF